MPLMIFLFDRLHHHMGVFPVLRSNFPAIYYDNRSCRFKLKIFFCKSKSSIEENCKMQ